MENKLRTIKFHYFSDNRLSSILIKIRTASIFQHVGMELDDGRYIESTLKHDGVRVGEVPNNVVVTNTIKVTEERYQEVVEFLESIVGNGYDKKALLGFFLGMRFEDGNEWFCSEVGRKVVELGTGIVIDHKVLCSPGGLRLITATLEAAQLKNGIQ